MKKAFSLLLLSIFLLTACAQEEVAPPEVAAPDPVVKTMPLDQAPVYEITEIGTLKASQEVELVAETAGVVSGLTIKLGDQVTTNQILATIGTDQDSSPAQINLENAQLQLNNAQENVSSVKANNQDTVTKAQLRIDSLNTTLAQLNRNLNELRAQNAATQTSLELQRNTLLQNQQLSNVTGSTVQNQISQTSNDFLVSAKTTLDAVFVNLDSQFANAESILNPNRSGYLSTSDVPSGFGDLNFSEVSDAVNTYNNYKANLQQAKSNYQASLPLSDGNSDWVILETKQRVDELRILLAEVREMLNATSATESLPAQTLEAYKGMLAGAEAAILADLANLNALNQSIAKFKLEQNTQVATAETNQVAATNQLAEAENALQKFYITSKAAEGDLAAQIRQTQIDLYGAQSDLATAARTAGIQNSTKDLEISTLNNQVRLAENALEDNKIVSTIDGTVSELSIDNGDYVSPGAPVATLVSTDLFRVVFYLSEADAQKVTLGQAFTFTSSDDSLTEYQSNISKIAPVADPLSKKIQIEGLVEGSTSQLKPETFVNVRLNLSSGTFDANKIYVPMNAIIFGQNERYVYVVENGMAMKRSIEIGEMLDDWVEVVSGLSPTDLLIVEGQRNLPPEGGVKVNYDQSEDLGEAPINDVQPKPIEPQPAMSESTGINREQVVPAETLLETPTPTLPLVPETGVPSSNQELYPLPEKGDLDPPPAPPKEGGKIE